MLSSILSNMTSMIDNKHELLVAITTPGAARIPPAQPPARSNAFSRRAISQTQTSVAIQVALPPGGAGAAAELLREVVPGPPEDLPLPDDR